MASFIAAFSKQPQIQQNKRNTNSAQNILAPNFQQQLAQVHALNNLQQQHDMTMNNASSQLAAVAAAGYKCNNFLNNIQEAQQHQQYTASLAKFMSYCQNADLMQRLITDKYK